jgi:hypothetical protein
MRNAFEKWKRKSRFLSKCKILSYNLINNTFVVTIRDRPNYEDIDEEEEILEDISAFESVFFNFKLKNQKDNKFPELFDFLNLIIKSLMYCCILQIKMPLLFGCQFLVSISQNQLKKNYSLIAIIILLNT